MLQKELENKSKRLGLCGGQSRRKMMQTTATEVENNMDSYKNEQFIIFCQSEFDPRFINLNLFIYSNQAR